VAALDRELPLDDIRTLNQVVRDATAGERAVAGLVNFFMAASLLGKSVPIFLAVRNFIFAAGKGILLSLFASHSFFAVAMIAGNTFASSLSSVASFADSSLVRI
jgi:hypothetical protein